MHYMTQDDKKDGALKKLWYEKELNQCISYVSKETKKGKHLVFWAEAKFKTKLWHGLIVERKDGSMIYHEVTWFDGEETDRKLAVLACKRRRRLLGGKYVCRRRRLLSGGGHGGAHGGC